MVMTADSAVFIHTNILVYATDVVSAWHEPARNALDLARGAGDTLVISPQILTEYIATMTRARAAVGRPTLEDTLANVHIFRREFRLLPENDAVITALLTLVERIPMAGKQVHDANIVATMQAHGIRRLLTHNTADFARFAGLITVVPLVPVR